MFKSFFYTVLFLMITTFSVVDSRTIDRLSVITKDLVLYWSFDEPTVIGKTIKDELGKRDGRLEGNPKLSAGKFGQALEFDGKADFATMDQMDLGDFTVEAWFKAVSTPGTWSRIFDFGKGGPGDIFVTPNHGRTGNDIGGGCHYSGGGAVDFSTGEKTKVGTWYHVALSFDKGGEGFKIYLNSEMKKHQKFNKESFEDWGDGQNWYLAKANWGDPLFPGVIDELRIYSRALSGQEIEQNMGAAGLPEATSVTANDQKLVEIWGNIKAFQ